MIERYCALAIGIIFLIVGLAGFIPGLVSIPGLSDSYVSPGATESVYAKGFGYVFGLFPTNFLHNIVRCMVGLLGIASYTSATSARLFNIGFAIAYILLAIMGLLPYTRTTFGLMPMFGGNVLLNALTAIAAAYYGFVLPNKVEKASLSHDV
jgi:hypothetical protein